MINVCIALTHLTDSMTKRQAKFTHKKLHICLNKKNHTFQGFGKLMICPNWHHELSYMTHAIFSFVLAASSAVV